MKRKRFCVPRVFVSNVATDFVESNKREYREIITMSLKEWGYIFIGILLELFVLFLILQVKVLVYILIGFVVIVFSMSIIVAIIYFREKWKKAKDECFDLLIDE